MLKIANFEAGIKDNAKQNEEQGTKILEIPKEITETYLILKI